MNLARIASQFTSRLNPFAKNCGKLIAKRTNIPVSEVKGIEIPFHAETMDIVEIATKKGEHTTITSFKDECGDLLSREILKKSKKGTQLTTRWYWGDNKADRGISYITKQDGKVVQTGLSKHVYSKENQTLYREKLTVNYNNDNTTNEVQFFEQLKPNKVHNYIKTTASRNSYGEIESKGIKSNIISQEEADKLGQTPYLYAKNYNKEEFLYAIVPYAKESQQVADRNIKVINKKLNEIVAGNSSPVENEISIDLSMHVEKSRIVNTINHELRHQYQNKLIECLDKPSFSATLKIIKSRLEARIASKCGALSRDANNPQSKRILSPEEKELVEKWAKEQDHYISPEIDVQKYRNQEIEKDARIAGEASENEYKDTIYKVQNLLKFPQNCNQPEWGYLDFI